MAERRPLPLLLARLVGAVDEDVRRAGGGTTEVPSLAMWAGLLRVVTEQGVVQGDVRQVTCVSRRAVEQLTGAASTWGWLTVEQIDGRRGRLLRLTAHGAAARSELEAMLTTAEDDLADAVGRRAAEVRSALEDHVGRLNLELPHYPIAYGSADGSLTGGGDGPGDDWSPVPRDGPASAVGLPLVALASQLLCALTLGYEREGCPYSIGIVRRELAPLAERGPTPVREVAWTSSLHRPYLESTGAISVERETGGRRREMASITETGLAAVTASDELVERLERQWAERHGPDPMRRLRDALEVVDTVVGDVMPVFVSPGPIRT